VGSGTRPTQTKLKKKNIYTACLQEVREGMMTEFTQRKLRYLFPLPPPRVKINQLWEEREKDLLLLACRKYGTKV
jgi:hypothetical protein